MRHIPEDELHAYLDQALSRSQCVEIERHLARCSRCQIGRDAIAALRDRTTALLAPIWARPPSSRPLSRPFAARRLGRIRSSAAVADQRGAWAASIVGAMSSAGRSTGRLPKDVQLPTRPSPNDRSACRTNPFSTVVCADRIRGPDDSPSACRAASRSPQWRLVRISPVSGRSDPGGGSRNRGGNQTRP